MSQMYGMSISEVQSLASQLDQKAGEIETIITTITSTLGSTQWVGPDATAFRSEWEGTHTAQLRNVVTALRDTATVARKNAQMQQETSAN